MTVDLDEDERRVVRHFAVYIGMDGSCYGMQGLGWCDAGASLKPAYERLRERGLLEVHFHEGEKWWKARLTEAGHAIARATRKRTP